MPANHAVRFRRPWAAVSLAVAAVAGCTSEGGDDGSVALPPVHGGFDYQLGGAYTPPKGVDIVSRDRTASPADGLYAICYVNAFQVQPGERDIWPEDLLLHDVNGDVVIDKQWKEPLLDISTADKRKRAAAKVNGWIDGCADKGFDAVEPDNYDSYEHARGLLTTADAEAFIALLSEHAHAQGLAIAQKNPPNSSPAGRRTGWTSRWSSSAVSSTSAVTSRTSTTITSSWSSTPTRASPRPARAGATSSASSAGT